MTVESGAREPRILLAEDDDELRVLLAHRLRDAGAVVIECRHGLDLIERLDEAFGVSATDDVDLLISDIRMPGYTGMEVLDGLNAFGTRCPVILMTAFGDAETHAHAKRLGAAAVLDKPFEMATMLGEVERVLARARRWQRMWETTST